MLADQLATQTHQTPHFTPPTTHHHHYRHLHRHRPEHASSATPRHHPSPSLSLSLSSASAGCHRGLASGTKEWASDEDADSIRELRWAKEPHDNPLSRRRPPPPVPSGAPQKSRSTMTVYFRTYPGDGGGERIPTAFLSCCALATTTPPRACNRRCQLTRPSMCPVEVGL